MQFATISLHTKATLCRTGATLMPRYLYFAFLLNTSGLIAADLDREPILYSTAPTDNAITKLEKQLRDSKRELTNQGDLGYLESALKELKVPISSQVLVFSKTSLQRSKISPRTPRAIYFNDEVTIGYCQKGDVLEVAAADSQLGTVFYTLNQDPSRAERFTRQTEACLICHASSMNQGFPGHLFRSVSTDNRGELVLSRGSKRVDQTTPIPDRWGGWYVTGRSGSAGHQGNQIVGGWEWSKDQPSDPGNVTSLKNYFTVGHYLSPHSDLVALMVLEHQGEAQNRLTRSAFQTRLALHEQRELNKAFGEKPSYRSESITKRIEWACEPVVEYFLFSEEAKLAEPVSGTSAFTKEFAERGPFDTKQRSLREFDLKTRLFRNPLSYLIYSKQFDALPPEAKARIYLRLWEVLSGKDQSKPFAHLDAETRRTLREIVAQTKRGLPEYWKE